MKCSLLISITISIHQYCPDQGVYPLYTPPPPLYASPINATLLPFRALISSSGLCHQFLLLLYCVQLASAVSLLKSGEQRHIKAINNNFNILKTLTLLVHAGLFWCFHNPLNSDLDYRTFNMCTWSLCMHVHAGGTSVYSLI